MRAILVLVVVVIVLALLGWVTFNISGNSASATVETEKIERDMDRVSNSVDRIGTAIDESVNDPTPEPAPVNP